MKKADIAKSLHEQAGISETQAADLLERVLALLTSTLQQGEPIIITGFGKLTPSINSTGFPLRQGKTLRYLRHAFWISSGIVFGDPESRDGGPTGAHHGRDAQSSSRPARRTTEKTSLEECV